MAMLASGSQPEVITHGHLFCGTGGGARGFNDANPRVGPLRGRFVCVGGVDNDAKAIRNFSLQTGVPGTVMDLFDEDQYRDWHGCSPPAGWSEAGPDDIFRVFGCATPDVVFTSAPCKGFSGLLSAAKSKTDKYRALNRLTVRGLWLLLEAFKHDPVPIILFENVPRIATRGSSLLAEIDALFRAYGYIVNADTAAVHDCGEIGGLAQTRKRYLRIARHPLKIPPFIYQPSKHRLRGVGEVLEKLPLPGDPAGGVHHGVPKLQFMTWLRLALVEAGKDWRSLNRLRVKDGMLQDYGLIPEFEPGREWRDNVLGVLRWGDWASHLVGNQRSPLHGKVSIADPRIETSREGTGRLGVNNWGDTVGTVAGANRVENGAFSIADIRPLYGDSTHRYVLGVRGWHQTAGVVTASPKPSSGPNAIADVRYGGGRERSSTLGVHRWEDRATLIAGESYPTNGAYSVADVRPPADANQGYHQYGVHGWGDTAGTVSGQSRPGGGVHSIADVRIDGHAKSVQLGVRTWSATAPCLKGDMSVGGGPYAIADIRMAGKPRFNNTYRIVRYDSESPSVPGPGGPGGGLALADPRAPNSPTFKKNKYKVTPYGGSAGSVIAASTTGDGAFAVADVRGGADPRLLHGKYRVEMWIGPSRAVIGGRDQGAFAIGDPRPAWGSGRHENVMRVTPSGEPAGTVPANAHSVTGGHPCVADERPEKREHYQTGGHYGVVEWDGFSLAVSGSAKHDNGFNNVAEPRPVDLEAEPFRLPAPTDKLVCRIIAEDGTWHRPFTTLELAGLQSLFDPEEAFGQDPETGLWMTRAGFELVGGSDAMVREWIGNAVPSAAARGMAETIGEAILLSRAGETAFKLDSRPIWVKPLGLALAVDSRQVAFDMDGGLI